MVDRLNFVHANDNFIEIENMKIVTQLNFYMHVFLKNLINILWYCSEWLGTLSHTINMFFPPDNLLITLFINKFINI